MKTNQELFDEVAGTYKRKPHDVLAPVMGENDIDCFIHAIARLLAEREANHMIAKLDHLLDRASLTQEDDIERARR